RRGGGSGCRDDIARRRGQDGLDRLRAQAVEQLLIRGVGTVVQILDGGVAEQHLSHGQRCLAAVIGAALHYCLVKQAFGSRGGDLAHDAVTAGGFTEDGDVVRVAIKRGDVFLHPAQCQLLVLRSEEHTSELQSRENLV